MTPKQQDIENNRRRGVLTRMIRMLQEELDRMDNTHGMTQVLATELEVTPEEDEAFEALANRPPPSAPQCHNDWQAELQIDRGCHVCQRNHDCRIHFQRPIAQA